MCIDRFARRRARYKQKLSLKVAVVVHWYDPLRKTSWPTKETLQVNDQVTANLILTIWFYFYM